LADDWVNAREAAAKLMDVFLRRALDEPLVLAYMAAHDVTLPKVKDLLTDIVLWLSWKKGDESVDREDV